MVTVFYTYTLKFHIVYMTISIQLCTSRLRKYEHMYLAVILKYSTIKYYLEVILVAIFIRSNWFVESQRLICWIRCDKKMLPSKHRNSSYILDLHRGMVLWRHSLVSHSCERGIATEHTYLYFLYKKSVLLFT